MKLKIPVFWHTEESAQKEELGIDTPITDADIRYVTFYTIDSVTDYVDSDTFKCTQFYCHGILYVTPLSREELEKRIDEQLKN